MILKQITPPPPSWKSHPPKQSSWILDTIVLWQQKHSGLLQNVGEGEEVLRALYMLYLLRCVQRLLWPPPADSDTNRIHTLISG